MKSKYSYIMLPIVIIFGIAIWFLFIVMMDARSIISSKKIIENKTTVDTDATMAQVEEIVAEYFDEKCSELADKVKREVDKEVADKDISISEDRLEKKYNEAYRNAVCETFSINVKVLMRDLNSLMPKLDIGSIYVNTETIPKLTYSINEETGALEDGKFENVCFDYMYKGEIMDSISTSYTIINPLAD